MCHYLVFKDQAFGLTWPQVTKKVYIHFLATPCQQLFLFFCKEQFEIKTWSSDRQVSPPLGEPCKYSLSRLACQDYLSLFLKDPRRCGCRPIIENEPLFTLHPAACQAIKSCATILWNATTSLLAKYKTAILAKSLFGAFVHLKYGVLISRHDFVKLFFARPQ